jgi:oxysterol-binding protein-related protein 9/10/11
VHPTEPPHRSRAGPREVKISYLTEQTSHHPPVSAFYIHCPQTGVSARGFDQINAKFTGTSIRVNPGQHTLGIFVNLERRENDEYQLTHPAAHLGGLLRGSLSITVADSCYMTCPKTRIKVILQYLEDGWIGRSQNRLEGVVFRYNPEDDNTTKMKSVPHGDILKIHGSWHQQIYYTLPNETEPRLLIDVAPLFPVAKIAPPEQYQLPNESRRFWSQVTTAILEKQYGQATKFKHEIEDRQRIFESSWLVFSANE